MGRTTVIMLLLLKIQVSLTGWTYSKEMKALAREQTRRNETGPRDALTGHMGILLTLISNLAEEKKV